MDLDSELLCSPRKIRRLASSSENLPSQKLSQESRATSTPTRRSLMHKLSISSEISSINQESPANSRSTNNRNEEEADVSDVLSLINELSLSGKCSVYSLGSEILHRPNPRIFRGKAWTFFKPKYQESLYSKVLENFDSIEDIAFEFLEELRSDEIKGTLTMIKFFVDLCGYQWARVDEHFDFDKDFSISCQKVIKLMEFDFINDEMLEANTYIFFEADKHTKLGETLASAVNSFIEKVMIGAYGQNILFSRPFHKYIFQFLFYMCQGILRSIRHTGVTLTRMILKVLNYIYLRIVKKLELGDSQRELDLLPIEKEIEYAEKYIQHFFDIFVKNSFIPDSKLYVLRAKNVKEMGNWMIEVPQVYFANCTASLFKLQLDESEIVRLNVVQVWKNLIKTKTVYLHVVKHLNDIVKLVQGRLKDSQLRVVVEAVDFFSVLVDNHPRAIGEELTCDITELLYAKSYLCAKAAGFFTIKFFNSAKLNETDLLKKLVDISSVPRFQKIKHFFVESFMEHSTVLDNYKLMMEVLLSCKKHTTNDFAYALALIELMYYSIYQKLKGEPLIKRKHSFTASPVSFSHEEVAKVFLLNLQQFMSLFSDQTSILNYLLKILNLIDYHVLTSSYRPHLIFLTKSCRVLFLNDSNEELLGNICKLYHYLCFEKETCLKESLHKFLVNLFENLSNYLQGYLEPREEQEIALELHFRKIGKLYEKFNMNAFYDWNGIFTVWGNELLCRGQMVTCRHYILWTIKEVMRDWHKEKGDEHRMKKINLKTYFSEYVASLVQLMTSSDAKDDLKLDAFESFCFVHTHSYETLMMDAEMAEFKLHILQSLRTYIPETLVKFFSYKIVQNKSVTFERRKKLICDWLGLILNALTDVLYIIPLFECYHTRSEEYGSLIEFVAAKIYAKKQEVFFQLIVATLTKLASHVFHTLCRSISSPEARELMALADKFSNMKEFSNSSKEVLRMLHLGFKHCFRDGLFELLVLLQNFQHKLSEEHYKDCLQIFVAMTPKEFENKEYVKTFRAKLQAGKPKGFGKSINKTISSTDIGMDTKKSEIDVENQRKKRRRGSTRKSIPVNESFKENVENKTPKKVKTPKLKKPKNK
ncbi:uncharacterized protein LOC123307634 [Coccinella septempunctata]|uniref:uncharacterized protein LOC123307634 n=1 Tax=Coccinella septempunctata TaxID=41139 RepID=UPI001D08EE31|nr:uncharacterized protein LOC123307634 [Coccinella septempunctata]